MHYKLKTVFMVCFMSGVILSCGKRDLAIYEGDADFNQTLLQIEAPSYDLILNEAGAGEVVIQVLSSTRSKTERTFDIVEFDTNLAPNVDYKVDAAVVLPANEYIGSFKVQVLENGQQGDLKVRLGVSNAPKVVLENAETTINIK